MSAWDMIFGGEGTSPDGYLNEYGDFMCDLNSLTDKKKIIVSDPMASADLCSPSASSSLHCI